MSGGHGAPTDGVSQAMDALPFARRHFALLALLCMGHIFNVVEMVMSSVFGTIFASEVKAGTVTAMEVSLLLGAAGFGAALGSPLLGSLADRVGRRTMLSLALAMTALFSLAGALVQDIETLIVLRVIASIGIGAYVPLETTYIAEMVPARLRGRAVAGVLVIAGMGGTLSGLLSAWFGKFQPLGLDGWRWTMIVAAIGCVTVAALLLRMPESPRLLMARGRREEALAVYRRFAGPDAPEPDLATAPETGQADPPAAPAADSLWTAPRRRMLAFFVLLSAILPWALTSFPMLSGAIFTKRGFSTHDALVMNSVAVAGVSLGSLLNMLIVDRVARDRLLIAVGFGAAAAVALFAQTSDPLAATAAGLALTACLGIYQQVLLLHAVEQFPALLRGRVPGICYGVNRGAAILVPLLMFPLLIERGEVPVLAVMGSAMALSAVLLMVRRIIGRSGNAAPA